jgi:hypothetical protein
MPSASTAAKRDKRYTLRENDLITVAECNALIDKRVQRLQSRLQRRLLVLMGALLAPIATIVVLAIRAAK